MKSAYQVTARKFRPQVFRQVVGQDSIIITLKNAIKFNRIGQAYLFCGPRGTGKTTLARLFAKALNCPHLSADYEPCDKCSSCLEISNSTSIDVLEIDGASNRGIENIRQINDTVKFSPSSPNGYKIYIIDEVHMLTKEAFNALLKTLEEPPERVKFFFATTEPHKVLPTILSRCQRFTLQRISQEQMLSKLEMIAKSLNVEISQEALLTLIKHADGGLRDAESLFDQLIAFSDGQIDLKTVQSLLGLIENDLYFELDLAGKNRDLVKAFEITEKLFSQGKELSSFVSGLIDHIRTILLIKLTSLDFPLIALPQKDKEQYQISAAIYSIDQCLHLIDYLTVAQRELKQSPSMKIAIETLLLYIIKSHSSVSVEQLMQRLSLMEAQLQQVQVIQQEPVYVKESTPQPEQFFLKVDRSEKEPTAHKRPDHFHDTLIQFAAVELKGKVEKKYKKS